ncbi:sugar ABC transporter substrate-binding protein, partial [Saccharothrix sp. MB29]|nr:sugar ABC transporter substrate-binding protein [Saccharothrix sp. MB29]
MRPLIAMGLVAVAAVSTACGSSGPADPANGLKVWALEDPVLNKIEQKSIDSFKAGGGNASQETFGNDPYKQ